MKRHLGLWLGIGLMFGVCACNHGNPVAVVQAPVQPPLPPSIAAPTTTTGPGQTVSETIRIAPYRVACMSTMQASCYTSVDSSGHPLQQITDIQGFEYKWGHTYTIQANVAVDGEMVLNSVINDEPVAPGTSINLAIDRDDITGDSNADASGGCVFRSSAGFEFTTANTAVCQQLRTQLSRAENPREGFVGDFQFTGRDAQPLQLNSGHFEDLGQWTLIRDVDVDALQPSGGCRESILEIKRDGSYSIQSCAGAVMNQGRLSAGDLAQLEIKLTTVTQVTFARQACMGGANAQVWHRSVYLRGPSAGLYDLLQISQQQMCFHGDEQPARDLNNLLTDLRAKITGPSGSSGASPSPTPSVPGHIIRPRPREPIPRPTP